MHRRSLIPDMIHFTSQQLLPASVYVQAIRIISLSAPWVHGGGAASIRGSVVYDVDFFEGRASSSERWLAYGGAATVVALLGGSILWLTH